jgi:hypothetical protein
MSIKLQNSRYGRMIVRHGSRRGLSHFLFLFFAPVTARHWPCPLPVNWLSGFRFPSVFAVSKGSRCLLLPPFSSWAEAHTASPLFGVRAIHSAARL